MLHHYAAGRQTAASIPRGSIVAPYCCVGNTPRERREKGQWAMPTWDGPTCERLQNKRRANAYPYPSIPGLRAGRCLSWLGRAEQEMEKDPPDYDAAFTFYWIAFNAVYADGTSALHLERRESDAFTRSEYFRKIILLDRQRKIYNAILNKFWDPMVGLLKNKYVYQPFWDHHNGLPENENWESRFRSDQRRVSRALDQLNTTDILSILFYRLYVLRNQLLHGGATWNSRVNRRQVEDGAIIMAYLVPLFIELMMDNPQTDWGVAYYPVVQA